MIRKAFYISSILVCAAAAMGSAPVSAREASAHLERVHLGASRGGASVQLELSRSTRARYFTLKHPERAVIDLQHTRALQSLRLPSARGLIADIRIGRRRHETLRVVLVLRAAAAVHLEWLRARGGAPRLVVRLVGSDRLAKGTALLASNTIPRPIDVRHAPRLSGRAIIVTVDPGHGGVDPGTIGHYGTEEKNITLDIGRLLARRIDAQRGMRAMLTRNSDVFLPLRTRMRIARRDKADLFVSIHEDDVADRHIRGASVYILSVHGASSEAAHILAARENAADLKGGIQLDDKSSTLASVLLNLSQTAAISDSMTAARDVLGSLRGAVPVCKHRVQQAAFVVLKSPDIPSMLVETDYLSDPAEELRLRHRWYQRRIADAIFRGILAYFRDHPPAGTLFAEQRESRDDHLVARNQQ